MPDTYKGLTVPISSDLADGPQNFRQYTDSLPNGDALAAASVPIGMVVPTILTAAPAGWLLLDGSTITGAQATYPQLWPLVPASWRSGTDLILPNAKGRTIFVLDTAQAALDTIGELTGSPTATITPANLPAHTHTQQGTFTSGNANQAHNHAAAGGGQFVETFFGTSLSLPAGAGGRGGGLTGPDANVHNHNVTISGETGNGPGTATPLSIIPPAIVLNLMMRAA